MIIRKATVADIDQIFELYKATATVENGIARDPDEISLSFILEIVNLSLKNGLIFVAVKDNKIVAEIHCYKNEPRCFKHTFGNLILVVHPDSIGQGLGKKIFKILLEEVEKNCREIIRVELFVRSSNQRGIALYKSLGFEIDGVCRSRTVNSSNKIEADIFMSWISPGYTK